MIIATFRPYASQTLITVNDYVRIKYSPSCIFIICLYVELDHLYSGIYLVHISNNFYLVLFSVVQLHDQIFMELSFLEKYFCLFAVSFTEFSN